MSQNLMKVKSLLLLFPSVTTHLAQGSYAFKTKDSP